MMIIWWSKHVGVILSVLVCDIFINVLLQTSALVGPLYIVNWNARWNSEIRIMNIYVNITCVFVCVCVCVSVCRSVCMYSSKTVVAAIWVGCYLGTLKIRTGHLAEKLSLHYKNLSHSHSCKVWSDKKKVKSYHLGRNIPCSIILQTNSAIVWRQTSALCYRKVVCSYHYTISAMSPWSHL
jgi:hypothetical protein